MLNVILKTHKYTILLILLIGSTTTLFAQENSKLQGLLGKAEKLKKVNISASVVLQRGDKSRGCVGRGTCEIQPYHAEKGKSQLDENHFLATLTRKGNKLIISIDNKDITVALYNEQFKDNGMYISDDLEIPEETLRKLGFSGKAKFVAGNYAILNRPDGSIEVVAGLIVN